MTYSHLLMKLLFHVNNMVSRCNGIPGYSLLMNIVIYKIKIKSINLYLFSIIYYHNCVLFKIKLM